MSIDGTGYIDAVIQSYFQKCYPDWWSDDSYDKLPMADHEKMFYLKHLVMHRGDTNLACAYMGIRVSTLKRWCLRDRDYAEKIEEIKVFCDQVKRSELEKALFELFYRMIKKGGSDCYKFGVSYLRYLQEKGN